MEKEKALCHFVNGKRYTATRGEPLHENLKTYSECVKTAYGSLHGVTFGEFERNKF